MRKLITHLWIVFFGSLIILFQNCTRNDFRGVSRNSTTAASQGITVYEKSINELQPVSLTFEGAGALSFPDNLPSGVTFDEKNRTLFWIPAKGQDGDYSIRVQAGGVEKFLVNFHVSPLDNYKLRYGGPPFRYKDGDVGYIFVHGANEVDLCADRSRLNQYWGASPQTVAPDSATRFVACYDGRKAVADVAKSVAEQIMNANCGAYNKCIIITHSMGGLLMEHMFLHIRAPTSVDAFPAWYENRDSYKAVREKTLFVVSLASAAGGSKTADLVNGNAASLGQDFVGAVSRWMGADLDSTKNLMVEYASRVVAPLNEDPGVPFFMVPGYSLQTIYEASGFFGGLFDTIFDSMPDTVFNGDRELALIDKITSFRSRSDGLVDFRSACGVASDNYNDGPGSGASLDDHFHYCWGASKKANHYLWFASSLNHSLITQPSLGNPGCASGENPCVARFPASIGTLIVDESYRGMAAIDVIRAKLGTPNTPSVNTPMSLAGN